MESLIELYTPAGLTRLRRRRICFRILLWAVALGGLAACVLLCLRTGTGNAGAMLRRCIAVSTVCGWVCIALYRSCIAPASRELEHTAHMLSGARETLRGVAELSPETVQIRRSIAVRGVTLRSGQETRRLQIHAPKARVLGRTPREMTLVAVHGYVAAVPAAAEADPPHARSGTRVLDALKRFFSGVHNYVLWLLISVFLFGFVFTRLTDTAPERKVTVFIDAYAVEDTALAAVLERAAPESIRMVKVHPFSYAMFDTNTLRSADIFLVKERDAAQYLPDFQPMTPWSEGVFYRADGEIWGVRVYDASRGEGAADSYIAYAVDGVPAEDYYLFFGKESLHTGKSDDAAYRIAAALTETE